MLVKLLRIFLPSFISLWIGWMWEEKGLFSLGEAKTLDWRFKLRGNQKPNEDILLIGIDEKTFQSLSLKYPFPPILYAQLIEKLNQGGAAVIGFDLLYSEPTRECNPPNQDAYLAHTLKTAGNVIWGMALEGGTKPIYPIPPLRDALMGIGYLNLPDEKDGVIRRFRPRYKAIPSFALRIVQAYTGMTPYNYDQEALAWIDYAGQAGTFPVVSFADVLSDKTPSRQWEGKICLVGAYFPESHDLFPTPFHDPRHPNMYGLEIQANIIATLLKNHPFQKTSPHLIWLILVILAFSLSFAVFRCKLSIAVMLWLMMLFSWSVAGIYAFLNLLLLPLFTPLILFTLTFFGASLLNYGLERNIRRQIKQLFDTFVDPSVVTWLLENPQRRNLKGERCMVTILVTDIQSFTTITAEMDPAALVDQLNHYFQAITEVALEEGGMVDKYIGDALMVIFGFPIPQADHPLRAYRAGLRILKKTRELNRIWQAQGKPGFVTRVGICSGEVIIGAVGGTTRKTITGIGDAANLASRLEGLNKRFHTRILLAESTKKRLPPDLPLKDLGEASIRGYTKPVRVFTVEEDPG